MIAFASFLAEAAEQAGMKVPKDPDDPKSWSKDNYPHFHVFCCVQLGVPVTWGNHWQNAEVIAALSPLECRTITLEQLEAKGFSP